MVDRLSRGLILFHKSVVKRLNVKVWTVSKYFQEYVRVCGDELGQGGDSHSHSLLCRHGRLLRHHGLLFSIEEFCP